MIRIATQPKSITPAWHTALLAMLPAVTSKAQFAFRHLRSEARQEAVQEVIAHTAVAVKALYDRGKSELAYPSSLARYGINQVKDGRQVGTSLNIRDVSSRYCQQKKHVNVESLDRFDRQTGQWQAVLVEDRHAGPAQTAAARIDFGTWFAGMSPRNRRIAKTLATGERTDRVARKFKLSKGRIS
jgi:hypothetical protein